MALARLFDGIDDVITGTLGSAVNSGDWSQGTWIAPTSAGENNAGTIFRTGTDGAPGQSVLLNAGPVLLAIQHYSGGSNAQTLTSVNISTTDWTCAVCTFRASDLKCRIYLGTADSAMAEAAYTSQIAAVGTRVTASTAVNIGNRVAGDRTWAGRIGPGFFCPSEITTTAMDAFRTGLVLPASCRLAWMMDSRTAATVNDYSGNSITLTVSGPTLADGPPVGYCRHARLASVPFARTGRGAQIR